LNDDQEVEFVLFGPHAGKTIAFGRNAEGQKRYQFTLGRLRVRGEKTVKQLLKILPRQFGAKLQLPPGTPIPPGMERAMFSPPKEAQRANPTAPAPARAADPRLSSAPGGPPPFWGGNANPPGGPGGDGSAAGSRNGDAPSPSHADLRSALMNLDPNEDSHWTANGAPAVEAVKARYAGEGALTRLTINEAAPEFSRTHRSFE